jgi:signal peptidase II
MFENKNLILSCVVFLVLIIIIVFLYKNVSKLSKIKKYAFYLILSGGFGNLSDRLLRGAVVDFIDFGINSLRWPSFNIADSCIFVATILFFIDIIFIDCKKNNN